MKECKTEFKLTVGDDLVEKILSENPELKVQITDLLVKNTATRIIKSSANDNELRRRVQSELDKAVHAACRSIGFENVGDNWRPQYKISNVLMDEIRGILIRDIEATARTALVKMVEDDSHLSMLIHRAISKQVADEVAKHEGKIVEIAEKAAEAALKKKLGME